MPAGARVVEKLEDLAQRVVSGGKVDLVGAAGTGRSRALLGTARLLEANGYRPVVLRVSPTLDKVEHALVALGDEIGDGCASAVDEQLQRAPGRVEPVLSIVESHLGNRPLLVDDADDLRSLSGDDLEYVFRAPARTLAEFIEGRAALRTTVEDDQGSRSLLTLGNAFRARDVVLLPAPELEAELRRRVADDPGRYPLAVARALLQLSNSGEAFVAGGRWSESAMLEDLWRLADADLRDLLQVLAAHVRPLDQATLKALGIEDEVIRRAKASWLVESDGNQLWLSRSWLPWIAEACELRPAHERLAGVFEQYVESTQVGSHVALLEVFRHYLAADEDLTRARRFLRHSVASLLQRAHDLSAHYGRWKPAARLYREVLDLDSRLRASNPGDPNPIGKHPRAYATHYWHYNLYKLGAEAIEQTEAGYEGALHDWPTNALFWSRLVVAKVIAGKWVDAFQTLDTASRTIPSAAARDRRLIERTTRKLLERSEKQPGFAIAALAVWREHRPHNTIYGESTVRALQRALKKGASVTVLPVNQPITFHMPVRVAFTEAAGAWACRLDDVDVAARSQSMFGALERAAAQLRDETRKYLSALTHRLDASERERKRLLLGRVNVVASAITSQADTETWILARVERVGEQPRVSTLDGAPLDAAAITIPSQKDEDDLWLVRVRADATGSPMPHVVAFEEALTGAESDSIWKRWAQRWQHHA